METENILAVNVPNTVSITIMALVGTAIVFFARQAFMKASGGQ